MKEVVYCPCFKLGIFILDVDSPQFNVIIFTVNPRVLNAGLLAHGDIRDCDSHCDRSTCGIIQKFS
jgi:hypothetical protein